MAEKYGNNNLKFYKDTLKNLTNLVYVTPSKGCNVN